MKITKLGHCCLLVETKGKRILTDPGMFTAESHSQLENLDAILFTHDHPDHYHLDSLRTVLEKNPEAKVYANTSVASLLAEAKIGHILIQDGETIKLDEVTIEGIGNEHAIVHKSLPVFANTGYFIDERFFYPGDAFIDPKKPVDILALPVAGPWMKISDVLDYAELIHPRIAFPVHDFIRFASVHSLCASFLPTQGIDFVSMAEGDSHEF